MFCRECTPVDGEHEHGCSFRPAMTPLAGVLAERAGYVGWVEFLKDQVSTTHIAYLSEDGTVYFPEPNLSEWDLRASEAAGRMWPLIQGQWANPT